MKGVGRMKPRALMSLGAFTGIVSVVMAAMVHDMSTMPVLLALISGAVFGKGYGLWEAKR